MKKLFLFVLTVLIVTSCGTISDKGASWVNQPQIKRSQALAEGLHRWDLGLVYSKYQDEDSDDKMIIPWFFTYSKGLSDKLTINWALFLPSWTLQIKNSEKVKISSTTGFTGGGYSTSDGLEFTLSSSINSKFIITNIFGVSLHSNVGRIQKKSTIDSYNYFSIGGGLLLQLTDFWLITTGISFKINNSNSIAQNYYDKERHDYTIPLSIHSNWNLGKSFDLDLGYAFSGKDYKRNEESHFLQLILAYYW